MIDKIHSHYGYFEAFGNIVYGNTLNNSHLMDSGKIHQQERFFGIDSDGVADFDYTIKGDDTFYVKMVKGNEYFIVPRRFIPHLPICVTEFKEIRLKSGDTQVWKYVTNATSLAIPERKGGTLKQFIEEFNPMSHSEPRAWTLLKLVSLCKGLKLGICSPVANGKNANLTIRRHLDRHTLPKVKAPSRAMLYSELYYNDYINLDEITSWSNTIVGEVEDLIAEFGDDSPDMNKYAKDKNKAMELMKGLLYKSLTFTFNPYDEKHNSYTFNEKFRNPGKIRDRYPIIFLSGKVLDMVPKPSHAEAEAYVMQHLEEYKQIASRFMYWRNNYDKHLHGHDQSKTKFKRRHLSNISPLLGILDVYSDTQEEYDGWLEYLNDAAQKYERDDFSETRLPKDTEPEVEEEFIKDFGDDEFE